jgi:hypothetical protein
MRPRSGDALRSGQASPPIRLAGCRRFVGLRSLLAVSSVARGRIEFVSQPFWAAVLRTIRSLPVASHPASRRRGYFQLLAFSSAREGLSPSNARSLSSALAVEFIPRFKVKKGARRVATVEYIECLDASAPQFVISAFVLPLSFVPLSFVIFLKILLASIQNTAILNPVRPSNRPFQSRAVAGLTV